jgi:uncharacterized protein with NAD-binding domain and iron-sulfur cluster
MQAGVGTTRRTRRRFLQDAAVAAGALAVGAPAAARAAGTGRTVAVFGAGVAGLTAAHELAERGFDVTVYERDHLGGKAWSLGVPGSGSGGRPDLPGEHGFRFFPGFYKNLGDTMRRIPTPEGTIYDRLVRASSYRTSFENRPDLTIPLSAPVLGLTPDTFKQTFSALLIELFKLPANEAAYFAAKLAVYVTSCDARRLAQWDHLAWKDFIQEDRMSAEYRDVVSRSLVRNLAATKSSEASTHAIGLVGLASVMSLMGRGNDRNATFDRVLDGPTSEVWLDTWVALLRGLGVTFNVGWTLEALHMDGGRISGATVSSGGTQHEVTADYYVSAIPCERVAALLTPEMLAADPSLAGIPKLKTDWMSGIQFYLRERMDLTNGHVNYVNSPFALTSISQQQFWGRPLAQYGDGTVKDSFSVILSDWVTPGILYGKPAKELTPDQIAKESFAQIQAHLNDSGSQVLRDDMLHSWFLDPAIKPVAGGVDNDTPLFIQDPGEWGNRPESVTRIRNFFLAGEWVRTNINVTTMDGANQGGRQAANGVLAASGSTAARAPLWKLLVPPEFEAFRLVDQVSYRLGLPNAFDPDRMRP